MLVGDFFMWKITKEITRKQSENKHFEKFTKIMNLFQSHDVIYYEGQ